MTSTWVDVSLEILGLVVASAAVWIASARHSLPSRNALRTVLWKLGFPLIVGGAAIGWCVAIQHWREAAGGTVAFPWQESWWWQIAAIMGVLTTVSAMAHALTAGRTAAAEQIALASAEAERGRTELAALRAQLSPQLLSGVLAAVRNRFITDPVAAERAIERLGDVLHYVLRLDRRRTTANDAEDHRGDQQVMVGEEWEAVTALVDLERFRLDLVVLLIDEIEDDAWSAKVPPFVLLPLVETAIHCIADSASSTDEASCRAGSIIVRAHLDDEENHLRLSVLLSSPGELSRDMNADVLNAVRRRLTVSSPEARLTMRFPTAHDCEMCALLSLKSQRTLALTSDT